MEGGGLSVDVFTGGGFAENSYLVQHPERGAAVVVDPGAAAPAIADRIRNDELQLAAILLTHAHLDHIEGIPAIRRVAPDAPIHLHPADRGIYDAAHLQALHYGVRLEPLPPPDRDLHAGRTLDLSGIAFEVRFTPGHAPGHVILLSPEEGFALVGDVVFQGSIGRTDLPGGDYAELMASIREQVLTLPDETRLLPGHGPETTVGRERRGNPFLTEHTLGRSV